MLYDLKNPSDTYTFEAPSREVACLAVWSLSMLYGASSETNKEEDEIPILGFFGEEAIDEFCTKNFGRNFEDGLKALHEEVADCLDTFILGDFSDWKRFEAAKEAIDNPKKFEIFKEKWQDARTSLNDIGGRASALAKKLRNEIK